MPSAPSRTVVGAAVLDVALLLAFVLVGRSSHAETLDPAGVWTTFWPFGAGLVVGWLGARAWRAPLRVLRTGVWVWLAVLVIGMLLRLASGQGVETSFVIVAAVSLGVFLVGWRAIAAAVVRARASRRVRDSRAVR